MLHITIRFIIGGLVVSSFAFLGNILRPKSFAGIFGAAPSIAIATLSLTIGRHGSRYAATEARSMIVGSVAFFLYTGAVIYLIMRRKRSALFAASSCLLLWTGVALGLHAIWPG
ncbi:MAG: DUF3147 family protein [Candidatus Binataceae bacterium]